jgi:hypothetical protein
VLARKQWKDFDARANRTNAVQQDGIRMIRRIARVRSTQQFAGIAKAVRIARVRSTQQFAGIAKAVRIARVRSAEQFEGIARIYYKNIRDCRE